MMKKGSFRKILIACISLILLNGCKEEVTKDVISDQQQLEQFVENDGSEVIEKKKEVRNIEFFEDKESVVKNVEKREIKDIKPLIKEKRNTNVKKSKSVKVQNESKETKKSSKVGKLSFLEEEHDFGFIEVGEIVDYTFNFRNTGNADVNISNAIASCGCTTPVFPFLPIEPGETGAISVRFNSKDRLGGQVAIVTVYSDAENKEQELKLKGVIRSEIVNPAEFVDTTKN